MSSTPATHDADAPPRGVGVVVVAAGSGTRLGADVPKAFVLLAGRPLLAHAVETVAALPDLGALVIVVPATHVDPATWPGDLAERLPARTVVVAGGAERSVSAARGLTALDPACDIVLVHDAARALTPVTLFTRVIGAVRGGAAGAVPGLPVTDTIKVVDGDGVITGTPDRAMLRAVQTPQGFRRDVLAAAYASGRSATDDAALVEACGHPVSVVDGDPTAFKVTTADDLAHAERLLSARP